MDRNLMHDHEYSRAANALRASGKFEGWPLPTKFSGDVGPTIRASHTKAVKELGIKFRDFNETIVEMANRIIELGLVSKP
jgi:hypothetical protein